MNKIVKLIIAMLLSAFSASASSVLLTNIGTIDTLLSQTTLSDSGAATEETWIESVLTGLNGGTFVDITYTQLSEVVSDGGNWEAVTDGAAGDYAFDFGLGIDPAYFLVKVGGGTGTLTDNTHFLYENLASLQWAFLNLSDFGAGVSLTNISVISHVGLADATVPEPDMVGLLAIGLLGFIVVRRKMKV